MTDFLQEFYGKIAKVDSESPRPLWSVVIPTHNCGKFIEQTLLSVLVQDRGPDSMEIIVVDDGSTDDDPREIIARLGKDRIQFIQQNENVGKSRNYETGINATRGRLIHQLHGDDRIREGFYASMEAAFKRFPEACAFFCESEYINIDGEVIGRTGKESDVTGLLENWLEKIVKRQRIQTPSIVVRREIYEQIGGFDRRLDYFEDWEMWIRMATRYPFGFNTGPIAQYRVYQNNSSSKSIVSGKRIRVLRKMLSIVDSYIPEDVLQRCREKRSENIAQYWIRCIPTAFHYGGFLTWFRICTEALNYRINLRVMYYIFLFTIRYKRFLAK